MGQNGGMFFRENTPSPHENSQNIKHNYDQYSSTQVVEGVHKTPAALLRECFWISISSSSLSRPKRNEL